MPGLIRMHLTATFQCRGSDMCNVICTSNKHIYFHLGVALFVCRTKPQKPESMVLHRNWLHNNNDISGRPEVNRLVTISLQHATHKNEITNHFSHNHCNFLSCDQALQQKKNQVSKMLHCSSAGTKRTVLQLLDLEGHKNVLHILKRHSI